MRCLAVLREGLTGLVKLATISAADSGLGSLRVEPSIATWTNRETPPPLWTGHQPWLWHPGILAKYFAIDAANPNGRSINLVVDHDVQDAVRLDLPRRHDNVWSIKHVRLGTMQAEVPTGCQPAIDAEKAVWILRNEVSSTRGVSLDPLSDAWSQPQVRMASTLGRQVAGVLSFLMRPWLDGHWEDQMSTELCEAAWFGEALHALLHEAPAMAAAYNRAAAAVPEAGVGWLGRSREWVELPLWLLGWERPRRRVFADVSDTTPWLIDEHGQRLDWEAKGLGPNGVWLAPKALWMTALIRRRVEACGGFVHGTGGAVYDRAMEHWWKAWRNESLAPKAVATTDLVLDLPGPTADRDELARAVWWEHHLPHNVDRYPGVEAAHPELVAEKAGLLAAMLSDPDRKRRRAAFNRIHAINATLTDAHHVLIDQAQKARRRAEAGLANAAIRRKRDWCFALYPQDSLRALRDAVRAAH
ncbi:MAG: hypothetical protein AAF328_10620 [Planctomycetota bacterium]